MGTNVEMIAKAANELDKLAGKVSWLTSDWRSKIDVSKLDMYDYKKCVLGQLQGHYLDARTAIRVISPSFNFYAFEGFSYDWKEYLKSSGVAVGQVWQDESKCCSRAIKAVTEVDGETYVLYAGTYGDMLTVSAQTLRADGWTLMPAHDFKVGDLITFPKAGTNVFIYMTDQIILRLNYSNGDNNQGDLAYYTETYGEPKRIGNMANKLRDVKKYI